VSAFCYGLGVTLSYFLNRRWSFESKAGHRHDIPRFGMAYGAGLVATIVSMTLLVPVLGPAIAQLVTAGIAAITIFAALNLLRFGHGS
jgi:putative flippase GtrA